MDVQPHIAHEKDLLTHQLEILAHNMVGVTLGSLLLASGSAIMLVLSGMPIQRILGWLLVSSAYQMIRLGAFYRFKHVAITPANAKRWAFGATTASGLAGLSWGALGVLFFDADNPLTLAILAIVLSAMMASATNSVGAYWPAHLAFSLPCSLPFTMQCLLAPTLTIQVLGGLSLLYFGFTTSYARGIARSIRESLLLRYENAALVESLHRAKELAEAANQAKTRFLAAASHDLRQPIHAMNLSLPVLRKLDLGSPHAPRAIQEVTGRMQVALDTMGKLLHSLLDVSRLEAGYLVPQLQPCSVSSVMNTVVDQVRAQAEAKGIDIRVADQGEWVLCDEVMLHSMVSNLVHNAVRYTDQGGVLVGTRRRGDRIAIEVWDTGRGIPAEELPRLCEEFFQASNAYLERSPTRGFGLGLAIVRRMAALTGGELTIRSRLGRGSRFSIALPARAPVCARPTMINGDATRSRSRTLLVVDNDVHILGAMRELMTRWGHRVLVARNMEEARKQASDHAAQIDMALIDFHLNDQTTGLEAALIMRELIRQDLPLVVMMGDTPGDVTQKAQQAGICVFHKPVSPTALEGIIEAAGKPLMPCR